MYSTVRDLSVINHCDRRITLLSDTSISFGLFNLFTCFAFWVIVCNTVNVKDNLKIYLIEQKIYPNHQDGFLRRNISKFPEEIKKRAYQAIVRPNVEYASSAWDPYQENIILKRLKLCKEDLPVSLNSSTVKSRVQLPTY